MDHGTSVTCRLDYIRSIPGILKLIELVNIYELFKIK